VVTVADTADTSTRALRDVYGRQYHVGQDAETLTGHSRRLILWAAWLCMAAISPLQYGFGMAVPGLQAANDWGQTQTLWLLAVFVACQAGVAAPAAWMHRQSLARPAQLVVGGGVLATIGLLTLANVDSFAGSLLGYSVLGGAGAGLVYSACLTTAAKWFPERRVATIGFVTGGFACGAVPVIVVIAVVGYSAQGVVLTVTAGLALAVSVFAGRLLQDPPMHWWPPEIDAQAWAVDHRLNRSLPRNMPAVRHYTPREALRTGVLPEIWFLLAAITAVSLFGIAFVASYAVAAGMGVAVAGVATAVLAAVNGVVRATAGHLSDRFGRTRVLTWVLALEGCAQFALVASGEFGHPWAFVACAFLVGLGGGAFYAIFSNVVLEYFGDRSLLQNQAVVYSAKAVGGLVGIGGAAVLVSRVGYPPAFVVAGCLGLAAAVMVRFLKQPGRPALDVHKPLGTPTVPSR
jgi:MFS family permease